MERQKNILKIYGVPMGCKGHRERDKLFWVFGLSLGYVLVFLGGFFLGFFGCLVFLSCLFGFGFVFFLQINFSFLKTSLSHCKHKYLVCAA